jgi:hypothetical protein
MDFETAIQPFIIGLGIGLILCLLVYIREGMKRGPLKKEIKSLKNHLHEKMEIDAEATHRKVKEIDQLKQENENLRISIQSLAQKPGRREIINMHIYQKALSIMTESAHGFAPMWQKALSQAEKEVEEFEKGKSSFLKKIVSPLNFLGSSSDEIKKIDDGEKEND